MRFRIYYGDGTTYSGDPFLAPSSGVQAVAVEEGDGFVIRAGKDHYCWKEDNGWIGTDGPGREDYLTFNEGPCKALNGRTIRNDAYFAVVTRVTKEGLG